MRLLFIFLALSWSSAFAQNKDSYDVLITDVNIIDIKTGKISANETILIKNGRAEKIVGNVKMPAPKVQIDGTGKYLMASLYDMHVHYPDNNAARFFELQTAAGISHCRIMKSSTETFSKADNKIPEMKTAYNFFGNETYSIDSVAPVINSLKTKGYDFIKIFGVKDEAQFDAIMATAKTNNLVVCGHALSKVPAKKLLASGYKSIEHVGYFDKAKTPAALDSLIDLAIKNKVFVCPTLDWVTMGYQAANKDSFKFRAGYEIGKKLYGTYWDTTYTNNTKQFGGQEKQYKEFADKDIEKKIAILAKMRKKGLKIIAGSDAEEPYQTPGFSLLDELRLIKKAGFTNKELLQMVTINASEFYNFTPNPNTSKIKIAPPKASYILLTKNPLENINNLETVEYLIKGAEVIDCKALLEKIQ